MPRFSCYPPEWVAAAVALCWLGNGGGGSFVVAAAALQHEEKKMAPMFYQTSPQDSRPPANAPIAIRDGDSPALGTAAVDARLACTRPYCNAERNSRIPFRLESVAPRPRWQIDLDSHFGPAFIMTGADRILLQGVDSWLLLDAAGKTLKDGRRGDGEMAIDAAAGLFYFPDPNGRVAAHSLRDGGTAFSLPVYFGEDFRRTLIDRRGRRVLVVSIERPMDPHGGRAPALSVVELHDLGEPLDLSDTGRVKSARRLNYLMRDTVRLLAAAHADTLILATDDRVYLADADLRLQTELTGEFEPLYLSVDEGLRLYLIARTPDGAALWVMTAAGERVVRMALPGFEPAAPPIVGYDHRVYIVSAKRVVAVSPEGKLLWERSANGRIGGAVVTADNHLLVAAGSQLAAYDADGKQRVLFSVEGEQLRTPPVLTEKGELLVASERRLYCVAPKPTDER